MNIIKRLALAAIFLGCVQGWATEVKGNVAAVTVELEQVEAFNNKHPNYLETVTSFDGAGNIVVEGKLYRKMNDGDVKDQGDRHILFQSYDIKSAKMKVHMYGTYKAQQLFFPVSKLKIQLTGGASMQRLKDIFGGDPTDIKAVLSIAQTVDVLKRARGKTLLIDLNIEKLVRNGMAPQGFPETRIEIDLSGDGHIDEQRMTQGGKIIGKTVIQGKDITVAEWDEIVKSALLHEYNSSENDISKAFEIENQMIQSTKKSQP